MLFHTVRCMFVSVQINIMPLCSGGDLTLYELNLSSYELNYELNSLTLYEGKLTPCRH